MKTCICLRQYRAKFLAECEKFQTKIIEKHTFDLQSIFPQNCVAYELMWKILVETERT